MNPERPIPDVPLWQRLIIGRKPKRTLIRAALLILLALVVFKYVLLPVRISGNSMLPAYRDGGVNFIKRLSYRWSKPRRGDVVGVMMADEHVMLFKRVIGLPGETVAIRDGIVLINGQPLPEPYVKRRAPWQLSPRNLDGEKYFLIGDNRDMDQESHLFGAAEAWRIVGKVLW